MQNCVRILIGATSSGSGKTTFTLGLLRALSNRGLSVQPFKCGPDYIDTHYHALAAKSGFSINLDRFLMGDDSLKLIFNKYSKINNKPVDACVVEGVMGLFDGFDKMDGSSAQLAEILDIPVLLVINAKAASYSVAPILYGYKNFYKGIKIAGVVFNMVGSENHYRMLKQACDEVGLIAFGYIPKSDDISIPHRHLGLTLDEKFRFSSFTQKIADLIENHVDIDAIIKQFSYRVSNCQSVFSQGLKGSLRIAVAYDQAFNFTYKENLETLSQWGELTFFSPIRDEHLPSTDFLYLPGGYPEFFAKELAANSSMLLDIKRYAENGGKIVAECGGMIYLCNSLKCSCDNDINSMAKEYKMVGVFPMKITMDDMKLQMGYRQFVYKGLSFKGHEFHYSRVQQDSDLLQSEAEIFSALNKKTATKLYRYKNVIASYTHIYWANFSLEMARKIFD